MFGGTGLGGQAGPLKNNSTQVSLHNIFSALHSDCPRLCLSNRHQSTSEPLYPPRGHYGDSHISHSPQCVKTHTPPHISCTQNTQHTWMNTTQETCIMHTTLRICTQHNACHMEKHIIYTSQISYTHRMHAFHTENAHHIHATHFIHTISVYMHSKCKTHIHATYSIYTQHNAFHTENIYHIHEAQCTPHSKRIVYTPHILYTHVHVSDTHSIR